MYSRCHGLAVLVSISTIGGAMTAYAADLYRAPPAPPVSYVPPVIPTNTWTGFYAGINGGYGWGSGGNTISYPDGDQSGRAQPQGGFGGGQIGYNYQTGSFVFGVETDFQGAGISDRVTGTTANNYDFTSKESIDWFGTVRGRLGFAFGNALFYGTGGFAYGNVNQRAIYDGDAFASNTTQTGYAAGGGIEYKFTPAWSVKAEYQFIDLGSQSLTDTFNTTTNPLDTNFQTARIGLNYRFGGGGYEPLK
jgi:outer membrane immunogenic protein